MKAHLKRLLFSLMLAAFAGGLSLPDPAHAQAAASVEGVQMPAWVERNGRRAPLLPGMALQAGDQIFTGAGSRAFLRLSEGSIVKLGENGTLRLTELNRGQEIFKATLGVLQGAFRFTTELIGQKRK